MRLLLAAATIAVGSSFALGALSGGDQALAMATAMAAFASAAAITRVLSDAQLVDHVRHARHATRDGHRVLGVHRVRDLPL